MVREKGVIEYGDGIAWYRGSLLGKGSFGSVYLATSRSRHSCFPPLMAVKSAKVCASGSIQKEREILSNIQGCPSVIECFGEETTIGDNGAMAYNLLLEYAAGGTLSDKIKKSCGGKLPEMETKLYARSILRGLNHIHELGFVHCDLKPDNILLVSNKGGKTEFRAKIGDFGLAKREKQSKKRKLDPSWRGTPMYLSPEAVKDCEQEAPSDMWAFGCIVLEMLTGKPAWEGVGELNVDEILRKIRTEGELPKIPNEISKEAMDFLKRCFVRKSAFRFTADMLLRQPFVEGLGDDDDEVEEIEEVEDLYDSEEEVEEADDLYEVESDTDGEENGSFSDHSTGTLCSSRVAPKRGRDLPISLIIPSGV